jgi:hypothetical protein
MKIDNRIFLMIAAVIFTLTGCQEEHELGAPPNSSDLHFSVTQDAAYDNRIFLQGNTPGTIAYWDYEVGLSNKLMDTVINPFGGEHWVKYGALGQGGVTYDSVKITITKLDEDYFSDPNWELLTHMASGKYWKVSSVYLGPESDYKSTWWTPDISSDANANDSIYFDLDGSYNFKRYHNGTVQKALYSFKLDKTKNSITIVSGSVKMPFFDYGNNGLAVNKYNIAKLTDDTLIVSQGASLFGKSDDWAWYTVYKVAN